MKNIIHIFSPHIDDAFLSLGGSILNWIERDFEIKVYNIFTISRWTTPDCLLGIESHLGVLAGTILRKEEEQMVASVVGFTPEFWNFLDLPLRENSSIEESEKLKEDLFLKISGLLNYSDQFFFPVGVGHLDHVLINDIAFRHYAKFGNIYCYEDMPYFSWKDFSFQENFEKIRKSAVPVFEKISYSKKAHVLRSYGSQVTNDWLRTMKVYANNLRGYDEYERYWRLLMGNSGNL